MHKCPIHQSDFKEIIEGGYLYMDKTKLIHTLIESGKYYFLGRPQGFGKSLLLSTRELFNGNWQLFKDHHINIPDYLLLPVYNLLTTSL
jgi:hypothetical protein